MRVYIAGPMRGIPEFNFPAFDTAAAKWRGWGFDVTSPADLDRSAGFEGRGKEGVDAEWTQVLGLEETIRRDLEAVAASNIIALLPGWEHSSGVAVELAVAKFLHKLIYDAETGRQLHVETHYEAEVA